MKRVYLVCYNLVNALGWAYVLSLMLTALMVGVEPQEAWQVVGTPLCIVQSLAAMEILHSLFRIVNSPLISTLMQVMSRLVVLWIYTFNFEQSRASWTLYLMVISWSIVEVPRYMFYAVNLYSKNVPFPLFWLRYSLFQVLYPTGISGELGQILSAFPYVMDTSIALWYLTVTILLMYVPGSPFMFFHMVSQRKKAMKARATEGKPPPPSKGIDFPLDPATNQRSTTIVNQGAIAASMKGVAPQASAAAAKERNWRFGYAKHIVKNVELCCESNAKCIQIAKDGLDYIYDHFDFVLPDGKTIKIAEAMQQEGTFETYVVKGEKSRPSDFEFYVPYQKYESKKVQNLKGQALIKQLDVWVAKGIIEPEAHEAIANMVNHPEFHSTALKDKYFVLLGAGSAMGPLRVLLELGANIIAVDIAVERVWQRIVSLARNSPGTLVIPVSKPAAEIKSDEELCKCAGADLLTATPQICNWIKDQQPKKQLVIGGYAYLDSALFVRLAIAMDAIIAGVLKKRKDAAIAFLCSPTDVFVTENCAHEARVKSLNRAPLWQKLLQAITPKNMLVPNAIKQVKGEDGTTYSIVDGLAVAQGPNYALAKRLQHWRCMIAREEGHIVSTNIAPSTATLSVVHNPQFAAAYAGMKYFGLEIVYQDLSNAVMTALMLNDVCNPKAAANPAVKIGNQIRLFAYGAFHGGIWRAAYKCGSIGEVSAMIGYARMYSTVLSVFVMFLVAFTAVMVRQGAPHTWLS